MQRKPLPNFDDPRQALEAGIAEADRREGIVTDEHGKRHALLFDGLRCGLDPEGEESILLRDILSYLRDYLLDRYSDEDAIHLLNTFEPRPGYRNMPVVDDDVLLAIDLLNMIRSAMRAGEDRHPGWPTFSELMLGKSGARDKKRQAGAHKPRRQKINDWIGKQLARNPNAKSPALWAIAPDWITDQIGIDRFGKRMTAVRKMRRK